MGRHSCRPWIGLLVTSLGALAIACGHQQQRQSYYLETRSGEAAYAQVSCQHEQNPDGFSVEFPRCFCNGGVKLDYVVERRPGGGATGYFVLRRGYLSSSTPTVTIVSRDGYSIERLYTTRPTQEGDRPVEVPRTARNRLEWQRNQALLAEIMGEYAPRLYEIEMLCRAKRIASI